MPGLPGQIVFCHRNSDQLLICALPDACGEGPTVATMRGAPVWVWRAWVPCCVDDVLSGWVRIACGAHVYFARVVIIAMCQDSWKEL